MNRGVSLTSATILVTGASGFVGGHLSRVLAGRGARLVGLGTESRAPEAWPGEWVCADLTDAAAVHSAIEAVHPDAVAHLAGQASAGLSFDAPDQTFRANVLGTHHLLEALRRHAPASRVLVVGSGEAYGPQPDGTRVAEEQPFAPVSPYAFSKAAADAIAEAYGRTSDLEVVRTRSFSHIGPGQSPRFAMPSFALQIAALEREGREGVLRVGNLDVVRDILDVRDVVEGYARLLESGVSGRAYNVCSGVGVPLRELVDLLGRLARVAITIEVDPLRFRPADVPYLVGDPSRMRADTSWVPAREPRAAVEDLLEACRRGQDRAAAES